MNRDAGLLCLCLFLFLCLPADGPSMVATSARGYVRPGTPDLPLPPLQYYNLTTAVVTAGTACLSTQAFLAALLISSTHLHST